MVKASEVLGRQITVREGGQDVGKIKDVVVDQTGREVIGIVLSDGMFSGSRVASWKAVQAFGPNSVIVDVAASVVKSSARPEIKAVLDKKTRIKGLKLLTTGGKELGKITDVLFDETTGDLLGYELPAVCSPMRSTGRPSCPRLSGSNWARMWRSSHPKWKPPSCRSAVRRAPQSGETTPAA